ncbi:MAG: RidA family protein [Tepidisphaeraceae bacterium]|jgi:enamine deaminase RidA (YjgF/YER057c/UK114 family)
MNTVVRSIESESGRELFVTVRPDPAQPLSEQALAFAAIRETLQKHRAWIAQERIYAPADGMEMLAESRARHYREYDDGVEPAWLVGGPETVIRGVQVYAVASRPQPLTVNGRRCARLIRHNGCRWITASALPAHPISTPEAQTRQAFEDTEALLKQAGGDLTCVARTWFHLADILDWYPRFNDTRTRFFVERGLLKPGNGVRLPASTGIGVHPANNRTVLMDAFAVVGDPACPAAPGGCLCKHQATGHQRSAFAYGSSFARAATVCTPAGRTVFVSGTAAIDSNGQTCHVGDVPGQIRMTIDCLHAALRDQLCSPRDVVQAIAYCKSAEVEACFRHWMGEISWPWIAVRGDICRGDLAFEAEITACVPRRRESRR